MCLDDDQIVLLLEGKLSESARAEVDAHLDSCAACRRLVGASTAMPGPLDGESRRDEDEESLRDRDKESLLEYAGTVLEGGGLRRKAARALPRGASIGRYLVLWLLGRGGMGDVYAAYDPQLDRRVALKLVHTGPSSESDRRRLVREARALGKISHPNVVQVHDVGEHDDDVFVAMELIDGEPLDRWCRSSPKPSWQEVLAAYLDAARGLSAAHAKGLVHRDVKPSNILRGKDGRVCVVDFGLAAGDQGGGPTVPSAPELTAARGRMRPSVDERLTVTGALLGTPAYMAPEQHEGPNVSPASDQYGLCAALYEGLYGVLPFTAKAGTAIEAMLPELLARKASGIAALPPAGSPVPAWVHKAIVRGLAFMPEDRHVSVEALVTMLTQDPAARRRRRWQRAGIGVGVGTLVVVAAVGWAGGGAADLCKHPERELQGVWDEGVKGRVRAAFLDTKRSYAEGMATRVAALLDRYTANWASMRGEVCEASRSRAPHEEILDLRAACLGRRLGQLGALTTLFAEKPDPDVLDKAVQSASELPPIAYCADTEALTARVHPPETAALRAAVAALQPRVDRMEALYIAGRYRDGLTLGEPLLTETAGIAYAPIRAQVQFGMGRLRVLNGDFPEAKRLFRDSAETAAEGGDDLLAASSMMWLLGVVGNDQRDFAAASVIQELGPIVIARAHDGRTQAGWAASEGAVLLREGKYAEAKAAHERALSLSEKSVGPDSVVTAKILVALGADFCMMGDCVPGKAILERAASIFEKAEGVDHPDNAFALNNLGNLLHRIGDYPGALAAHERAIAIRERALGPEHPSVGLSLNNLGNVLFDMGDYPRALATLERAVAIREKANGPDSPNIANALSDLGRVKVALNQFPAALSLLERALAIREKAMGKSHPEMADPLRGLGELYLARGKPEEAAPLLERALALGNGEIASELELTLAEALWRLGKERPRARELAEHARAAYQRIGHHPGLDRATRWLSDHDATATAPRDGGSEHSNR